MKKIICLIISLFIVYSCSNPVNQPVEQEQSTGSVSITLPEGSRSYSVSAASFSIQLVNVENSYDSTITANPGETVSINSLKPGDYTVSVKGLDSDSKEIMSGKTIVTVEVAKVANAQISLQYTSGGLNVEIDLPSLIEEPSTTPRRVTKEGPKSFTYNEDGYVSKYVADYSWGSYFEENYNFDPVTGLRTGSTIYSKNEWSGYLSETNAVSKISHDDKNREILKEFIDPDTQEVISEYHAIYDEVNKTVKYLAKHFDVDNNLVDGHYEIIDEKGRLIERSNLNSLADYWWFSSYVNKSEVDKRVTLKFSYWNDSYLMNKQEAFIDGVRVATFDFTVKEPGYYVYGELRTEDGKYIKNVTYGDMFEYKDGFAQSFICNSGYISDEDPIDSSMANEFYSNIIIYRKDLSVVSTGDYYIEYEEVAAKDGTLPSVDGNF